MADLYLAYGLIFGHRYASVEQTMDHKDYKKSRYFEGGVIICLQYSRYKF